MNEFEVLCETNIVDLTTMMIGAILSFAVLIYIIYITIRKNQKPMPAKNIIIPRELFEKLVSSLDESHPASYFEELRLKGLEQLKATDAYDIDALTKLIGVDVGDIINDIIKILDDGKINFKDTPHALHLYGVLKKLKDRLPELGREIRDIEIEEFKLLIVEVIDAADVLKKTNGGVV